MSSNSWMALEEKPTVRRGEYRNSKAVSFAAVLADERWEPNDDLCAKITHLKMELLADSERKKTPRAEKMLIVTAPKGMQWQTVVYFNLSQADQTRTAKRLLARYIERFGDHISKRADNSLHMLNTRDERYINAWTLAKEFTVQVSEGRPHPARAEKELLPQWAEAEERDIVTLTGQEAVAHIKSKVLTHTNALHKLEDQVAMKQLENNIGNLSISSKHGLEAELDANRELEHKLVAQDAAHSAKLDHDSMQDMLDQVPISVLNGWPEEPLYMVDFMSETEREELIKDSLPPDTLRISLIEQENADVAKRLQHSVADQVLQTGLDLMDEGCLPDFRARPQYKKAFQDRILKTYTQVTGDVIPEQLKEHVSKQLSNRVKGGHTCTHCTKPARACTHYLVTEEEWIWKPISELANEKVKDVKIFCSLKCEEKWQEVLICPDCNTYDYTMTTGVQSYPSPKELMDMTRQFQQRMLQADMMPKKKVEYTEEVVPEKPIKMWAREPRRVNVAICVTCSATMLPRNPHATHLCMTRLSL